ncbi:unnamed protein product [Amoebophrya sp. A120]|nr:unnamed protein product [Amoebophrya sp. A120]|eukprot:GSA120T00017125001.1
MARREAFAEMRRRLDEHGLVRRVCDAETGTERLEVDFRIDPRRGGTMSGGEAALEEHQSCSGTSRAGQERQIHAATNSTTRSQPPADVVRHQLTIPLTQHLLPGAGENRNNTKRPSSSTEHDVEQHVYEHDGTGVVLWPAAVLLSEYLVKQVRNEYGALVPVVGAATSPGHPTRATTSTNTTSGPCSKKMKILELGCGIGLPGITAAYLNPSAEVTLTDQCVRAAQANIAMQEHQRVEVPVPRTSSRSEVLEEATRTPPPQSSTFYPSVSSRLHAETLSWGRQELEEKQRQLSSKSSCGHLPTSFSTLQSHSFDLILGADLLYNQETPVIRKLVESIDQLLKLEGGVDLQGSSDNAASTGSTSPSASWGDRDCNAAADKDEGLKGAIGQPRALIAFEIRGTWFTQADFLEICTEEFAFDVETVDLTSRIGVHAVEDAGMDKEETKTRRADVQERTEGVEQAEVEIKDEHYDDPSRNDIFLFIIKRRTRTIRPGK